eukprot:5323246-Prymnesium_polylepis.2
MAELSPFAAAAVDAATRPPSPARELGGLAARVGGPSRSTVLRSGAPKPPTLTRTSRNVKPPDELSSPTATCSVQRSRRESGTYVTVRTVARSAAECASIIVVLQRQPATQTTRARPIARHDCIKSSATYGSE